MARVDWKSRSLKKDDYMFQMVDDGFMMVENCDRTIDAYLASANNENTGKSYTGLHATLADARKHCEGFFK